MKVKMDFQVFVVALIRRILNMFKAPCSNTSNEIYSLESVQGKHTYGRFLENNYQLKIFANVECINGMHDKTDRLQGLPYIHTTNSADS